jgi:hypothetical protein
MYLTTTCYDIKFYLTTILLHMIHSQSVTNIPVSASTNVITSAMQYLKLFSLDEGGSRFLQNIWSSVPDYTAATSVPLYQPTLPSYLSLCTGLSYHHTVPMYRTTQPSSVSLYQTTPLPHLFLYTNLQHHHVPKHIILTLYSPHVSDFNLL